jgi:LytS/YehU family sensor histidine kinase
VGREGVGLANVRRRLALCFGAEITLEISTGDDMTTVRFSLPCVATAQAARSSAI